MITIQSSPSCTFIEIRTNKKNFFRFCIACDVLRNLANFLTLLYCETKTPAVSLYHFFLQYTSVHQKNGAAERNAKTEVLHEFTTSIEKCERKTTKKVTRENLKIPPLFPALAWSCKCFAAEFEGGRDVVAISASKASAKSSPSRALRTVVGFTVVRRRTLLSLRMIFRSLRATCSPGGFDVRTVFDSDGGLVAADSSRFLSLSEVDGRTDGCW